MSTPAQNTMEVNKSSSTAAFQAKSAADKILSYMWYIHVLVSVNTEARLRAKIALVLEQSVSPATSLETSLADQCTEVDRQDRPKPFGDLTDHLILWLFSRNILSRLIDAAPISAQANGYARILADVPVSFHEEFCRRLYMLLFSHGIVEWPHGIDVPEPVTAVAEPVSFVAAPVELEDTHLSAELEQQDIDGAALWDGFMEGKDDPFESPASSYRPAASILLQTTSLSKWEGHNPAHTERAEYFGTIANQLPTNYLADLDWSRNGSGDEGSSDEYIVCGEQFGVPLSGSQCQSRKFRKDTKSCPCSTNDNEL